MIVTVERARAGNTVPLRDADHQEVYLATGRDPMEVVAQAVRLSTDAWYAEVDGEPAALWGVAPLSLLGGVMSPWMLASDAVGKVPKDVLMHSRCAMQSWTHRYRRLENMVWAENTRAIRWLRWLGFTVEDPHPHGPFGAPFHHFWWSHV